MGEEQEERSSVASAAKRLLKDSGRYLLAGVKAALSGPATPADVVFDAWHHGQQELQLERASVGQLVTACLARHTGACAEKGVDLLLEQGEGLPEAFVDAGHLEAVLEKVLEVAREACAHNRALRVRTGADTTGGRVVVTIQGDLDGPPPSEAGGTALGIAREILVAHQGELRVERAGYGEADDNRIGFTLVLPAAAEAGPA